MPLASVCFAPCHAAAIFGISTVRRARVLLLALTLVASQAVLSSVSSAPVLAQSERSPQPGASEQTAPATAIQRFEKPASAMKTERICGNDPAKCGTLWQELTFPHDATYQGRMKAQKAYNDCMARCTAASQQRQ